MSLKSSKNLVIAAFSGWNDAGDAASEAVEFLIDMWDAHEVLELDRDEFFDYQMRRPEVHIDVDGKRELMWPHATVYKARGKNLPAENVYLILGDEPNMRWLQFCNQLLAAVPHADCALIAMGAMLAEVAHTRPLPVHGNTSDVQIAAETGYEASLYEGPTGILGVLMQQAAGLGIPSVSLWAAVPHYAHHIACPKATLTLLRTVEDITDSSIDLKEIIDDSRAWEDGVKEHVEDDEDLADYVRSLEQAQDTAELPEASGEAIAREFERYLRRRES